MPLSWVLPQYRERVTATNDERIFREKNPFGEILVSLIYSSTRIRLDIAASVSMLRKFQTDLMVQDWKAIKNLLRYLEGILDYGIQLKSK